MRISDWSSDVCSSDLQVDGQQAVAQVVAGDAGDDQFGMGFPGCLEDDLGRRAGFDMAGDVDVRILDRQSVVSGKSVSVRVDIGGRRLIKKKMQKTKVVQSGARMIIISKG